MSTATVKIAPSILSADFAKLGDEIQSVENSGAHQIHVDIMDGHFVPNISMGPVVVESIRKVTKLPLDIHLMISQPEKYVEAFARAGSNALTFHIEASNDAPNLIEKVKANGMKAGIAIKPGTTIDAVRPLVGSLDIVLVMTVEPGFGGQDFLSSSLDRIRLVRSWLDELRSRADLTVDGGINTINARAVVDAGANVLVAGSSIYRSAVGAELAVMQFLTHVS